MSVAFRRDKDSDYTKPCWRNVSIIGALLLLTLIDYSVTQAKKRTAHCVAVKNQT